jgi:ABC-type transport system substrate-binding protein
MKRIIVLLALVAAFALLTACAAPTPEPTKAPVPAPTQPQAPTATKAPEPTKAPAVKTGGTVNYMIQSEPTTLLAWTVRSPNDQTSLYYLTNEFLMRFDKNGVPQPFLLDSIKPDPAALTFTLVVKKGIKFHDGSDLNADAVAWNLNNYKAKGVLTGSFYGDFDKAAATDANTVVVKMKQWNSLFPVALARTAPITSKVAFDTKGEDYLKSHPVGTGPFMFDKWDHDVAVRLVAFKGYWRGTPRLDGVNIVIYTNPQVAVAALKNKQLDVLPITQFDIAADLATVKGIVVGTASLTGTGYTLCYNATDPADPLYELKVRQAISYAIDSNAIAKATTKGYYFEGNQWAVTTDPVYSPTVTGFPYNPTKAKQLLTEAGHPNGFTTRITLQVGSLEDGAQIIAQQLAAVGIKAELNIVPVANYAGFIGGWAPGMLLHPMGTANGQASQLAANFVQGLNAGLGIKSFLHTDEVNGLIKQAVTADEQTSNKLFQQVAYKVFDEQALMKVIVLTKWVVAYSSDLKDANLYTTNNYADDWYLAWLDR